MVVTETLAAEMWCPFARTRWANRRNDDKRWQTTHGDGSFNRTAESFPEGPEYLVTKCVASECMAWRPQSSVRIGTRRVLDGLAGYKTVTLREETGFCGMAGAPVTLSPSEDPTHE